VGDQGHFGRILWIANWCAAGLALAILAQTGAGLSTTLDDSVQYWQAARNLLALGDPYATTPSIGDLAAFPNPPLLAYLFIPLAALERLRMQQLWFLLNSAALLGLVWLALRQFAPTRAARYWGVVLLAVISAPPTTAGLFLGQLGIMLALAGTASFVLARRHALVAGALLALAGAIKLYPALLGIYYLQRGPRRVVAAAIGAGAILGAAPILVSGLAPYQSYIDKVLLGGFYPYAAEFNVSLAGLWARLFTINGYVEPIGDLPLLARAMTLATALLVLGICLATPAGRDRLGRQIAFSAWICGMLLLTPLNGFYNLVALVVPFCTLLACLEGGPSRLRAAVLTVATLLACVAPGWSAASPGLDQLTHSGWGALLLTPALYGVLLYLGMLVWYAWGLRTQNSEPRAQN
jgi:Glycosyltransferase family 87